LLQNQNQPTSGVNLMTRKFIGLLAIGLVAVLAAGCVSNDGNVKSASSLNSNPPEVVKLINAAKDGHDGISVNFVLTDKDGKSTSSDGTAMLNIGAGSPLLFTKTFEIHKSDFKETAVGQGISASKEIICNLGYIPYTQFSEKPYTHGLENAPYRESSTVTLYFKTPEGKTLRGVSQIQWE
jgi:hypothetical protein